MKTPFRLAEHPRRPPLSSPPVGYFEQLPARLMTQVAAPARRPGPLAWLLHGPASLRTALASTLLLGTFAASLWLGGGPLGPPAAPAASLDAVPRQQLVDYLTSGETHLDMQDLAELPTHHLGLTRRYLRPSAGELAEALDAQAADEATFL